MASVRLLKQSFSGGEMSPEMFGRADDVKFQSGAATILNYKVRPQGPAENRAGFKFVIETKVSSKESTLLPFTYSTTQTMVIELGEGYIRFHTAGATLLAGSPAAYDNSAAYVIGGLVSSSGTNYYCIKATTGNAPANATYWYPLPSTAYEIPNAYAEADLFDIHYVQSADILTLAHPNYPTAELRRLGATQWTLVDIEFGERIAAPSAPTVAVGGAANYTYKYVVTAIHADGIGESKASSAGTDTGNIFTTGSIGAISWSAVTAASRYRVYKLQGGIFGYIGETETTAMTDDNIAPDLSITPPIYDDALAATNEYPGAVSYFEQRRAFGGTDTDPQKIWMTKAGTEAELAFSLPTRDSDRIAFKVAAREADRIRHIVPMNDLLLFTSSVEWRVTSVNSDAITPNTISVRPQSFIGASNVQPVIVNNSVIYFAARGGHVREMGYNDTARGYITGDLCLRAPHLFDGYEISQAAYQKAPDPIVWMVSTSGLLLGLTYVPEQQVGAFHKHDTVNGAFESCCVVAEGTEDHLYVIVKRTINGSTVRYIERMDTRKINDVKDMVLSDSSATYDGRNTGSDRMTISGGTQWNRTETLTVTALPAAFAYPALTDIGDVIEFTGSDGGLYRFTIQGVTSTTVVTGQIDKALPTELKGAAWTDWSFARDTVTGLTWLEGETLNILTDGAVHPQKTVSSGSITLDRPSSVVQAGLPVTADIELLPATIGLRDGSFGQGRTKNINKAWVRVSASSSLFVGPNADNLIEAKVRTTEPYGSPTALKTGEIEIVAKPDWNDNGKLLIRQTNPLPVSIVGVTYEVAIGG